LNVSSEPERNYPQFDEQKPVKEHKYI